MHLYRAKQLSRKDSSSSKNKDPGGKNDSKNNNVPPPPPPNNAKPQLPLLSNATHSSLGISFGGGSSSSLHSNASTASTTSTGRNGGTIGLQPGATYGAGSGQVPATPERRFSQPSDRASPAPPIVVVSPETHNEPNMRGAGQGYAPERGMSNLDGTATPPRTGPLNRLRQTPKDTIPIIGKPPRKQRSSRFVPSEKVEIERLPAFNGEKDLSL